MPDHPDLREWPSAGWPGLLVVNTARTEIPGYRASQEEEDRESRDTGFQRVMADGWTTQQTRARRMNRVSEDHERDMVDG